MARYTSDSKERVRDAVDMIDLVSSRTELRRAGVNRMTGLCPFHEERTPSFGINPIEKVYHCFGCQASGDAFTFVMETEGVDFKGALELLADRYKVALELEAEDPREAETRKRRERLMELLERTATFYVRKLWESPEAARAREYLAERGLDEGILREFRVGYAPSAWDTVLNGSRRAGFGNRELWDAGLAQKSEKTGKIYDRFRSQIIFPLADPRGRVRGFAGRSLVPDADRRGPKYVNSPENDLFHKRSQLFGADLARAACAKAGFTVAAEGYTDVIALHQVGLRNCVAIMGTALTDEQIDGLARLAPEVRLALDADNAGKDAMLRAARIALGRTPPLRLRVVALPRGEDPPISSGAPGARRSSSAWRRGGVRALPRAARARNGDLADAEGRDRVIDELGDVLSPMGPSAEREELRRIAADRLDMSPELLEQRLPRGRGAAGSRSAGAAGGPGAAGSPPPRPRRAAARTAAGARISAVASPPSARSSRCASPCRRSARPRSPRWTSRPTSRAPRRAARPRTCASTSTRRRPALADDDPLLAFMRELAVGDARTQARPRPRSRSSASSSRSRAWIARSRRRASRPPATSPSSPAAAGRRRHSSPRPSSARWRITRRHADRERRG